MDIENDLLKSVWPEWQIVRQLGKGSYGTVYEIVRTDGGFTSNAAVKIITIPSDPAVVDTMKSEGMNETAARTYLESIVDDFAREISVMNSLKGAPNIVSIEDYRLLKRTDTLGWFILIRMELLTPLSSYMSEHPFNEEATVKLARDMCSALDYCAKLDILHRDVKPQNVFVDKFGTFKLGDFGIARKIEQTANGLTHRGTYNYMAPEVARQEQYDNRADIYSLGIMLYQFMNSSHLPFLQTESQLTDPESRMRALQMRFSGKPLPPLTNASPEFARIIQKACAFKPENRYDSAKAMKKDLDKLAAGVGNEDDKKKPPKKKGLRIALLALLLLLVVGGAAFGIASVITKANAKITVPNVVGYTEEDAASVLKQAGLVSLREIEYSSEADRGKVLRQSVASDQKVKKNTKVVLTVSGGEDFIESIRIGVSPTNTDYVTGERINTAGLTLIPIYASGEAGEPISDGFSVEPETFDAPGEQTVTVRYGDLSAQFPVTVTERPIPPAHVTGIEVKDNPTTNAKYHVHDKFDPTGLTLTAFMSDGTEQTVTSGFRCTVDGSNSDVFGKAGKIDVKVSYTDPRSDETFSTKLNVKVSEKLTSVKVKTIDGAKVEYHPGEAFDGTGFLLTLHYDDGSARGRNDDISKGFAFKSEPFDSEGEKTVTFTYTDPDTKAEYTDVFTVMVRNAVPTEITLKDKPKTTAYKVGDRFDKTGLTLNVTYDDGHTETVTNTSAFACTVEGTDSDTFTKAGSSVKVTVKYGGLTTKGPITVKVYQLTGIEVKSGPSKTNYVVGDEFDPKGLRLTAVYKAGSEENREDIPDGDLKDTDKFSWTIKGSSTGKFNATGDNITVTLSYRDQTVTTPRTKDLPVKVSAVLKEIKVKSMSKTTEYFVGDQFDKTGLTLNVTYDNGTKNGTTKEISSGFTCKAESFGTAGNKKVTVTYKEGSVEKTTSFDVTVLKLTKIEVKNQPKTTKYFVGDKFDQTGLTLTATYTDGTTNGTKKEIEVTTGFICKPESFSKAGEITVTVEYTDKNKTTTVKTSFPVTVKERPELTGITVNAGSVKKDYFYGEAFNPANLVVTANYSDGDARQVTNYDWEPKSFYTKGSVPVTVSYTEGTKTVKAKEPIYVNVTAQVTGITAHTDNVKHEYFVGQFFDSTGLVVTANYSDGTSTPIYDYTCTAESFATPGNKTVTVSYWGLTDTFPVTVKEILPTKIELYSPPKKTVYFLNEPFDKTGLSLTVTYNNNTAETISDGFTCTAESFATPGNKTVTVQYKGLTLNPPLTVTVQKKDPVVTGVKVSLSGNPRTEYLVGDKFDPTGFALKKVYDDGTESEPMTSGFSNDAPAKFTREGYEKITFTYKDPGTGKEFKDSYSVSVEYGRITDASITSNPYNQSYSLGDSLDLYGIEVTVVYENGYTEEWGSNRIEPLVDENPENAEQLRHSSSSASISFVVSDGKGFSKELVFYIEVN
ncbi:MAG: bacterial Ig-like domain-containing protein [Clostridia bacterium]|nr:bacterial Ig-like domain-containing protein [Clostridia bacterium]